VLAKSKIAPIEAPKGCYRVTFFLRALPEEKKRIAGKAPETIKINSGQTSSEQVLEKLQFKSALSLLLAPDPSFPVPFFKSPLIPIFFRNPTFI
jgi:hypothetical protein